MINNVSDINSDDLVFSLDIGTRTVIGIVGVYKDNKFNILDSEIFEHEKRVMYDGQIHDINGVSEIAKKVKEKLEEDLGIKLNKVAIAAAGRALKTYRVRVDKNIDYTLEINRTDIESLEMEAIKKAQDLLDENKSKDESKYYCVGYSVVNYYLDNNLIENLEGHKGNIIGADVLATFLPHVVVDSLYTVMNRIGLEIINITLEPIAAINVAIKKNLRLLNLALVDIGAGTSDIAITKDGTIVAYAMASVAGDEITEKIAKTYLLDFDTAEKIKIDISNKESHEFYDIVGINHNVSSEEILDKIEDTIKDLAKEISSKIIEFNHRAPSAVFLIGGGSQIPRLSKFIADELDLQHERVVIRNTDIIENVIGIDDKLRGPHSITPIGIAVTAINNKYKDFLEVIVNGQKVKLFKSKEIKVSEALVLIGFNPRKLIPKRGKELIYFLNDKEIIIKGLLGETAKIYVNKKESNLERKLISGDDVKIVEATSGEDVTLKLFDCIDYNEKIIFNGDIIPIIQNVKVNGVDAKENIEIFYNDRITTNEMVTIGDLVKMNDIDTNNTEFYINEEKVNINYKIKDKDVLVSKVIKEAKSETSIFKKAINVTVNGEMKKLEYEKGNLIFVDIFNYIDFDISKPKGNLVLNLNGKKAEFHQILNDGDVIDIYWS